MRSLALALLLPATLAATQTITVSGGSLDPPYYTFDGGAPPTLVVGTTYEFVDGGISLDHPFRIKDDSGGDGGGASEIVNVAFMELWSRHRYS